MRIYNITYQETFAPHCQEVKLYKSRQTHRTSVPVDQVEDGVIVRLPLHAFVETLSLDSVQHHLQQVQLDWLLNENDVVL